MTKLFHAHKGNFLGLFFILPLFLYFAYKEIVHANYPLAIGSIAVWLFMVLFAMNYWFQALVLFIGALVAFYFRYWWAGILLILLSAYMVNAAKVVERGGLATSSAFREKLPLAGQIIYLLEDKKKVKWYTIVLIIGGFIISFFMFRYFKAP